MMDGAKQKHVNTLTLSRPSRTASFSSLSLVISKASWKSQIDQFDTKYIGLKDANQTTLCSFLHFLL